MRKGNRSLFCQKCGKENDDGTNICLYCGTPLIPVGKSNALSKKKKRWIVPLILIVIIVGALFMCLVGENESDTDTETQQQGQEDNVETQKEQKKSKDTSQTQTEIQQETEIQADQEDENYPFNQVISFTQNDNDDATGEMQILECYSDYDEPSDQNVIVAKIHVKNTGKQDIIIGTFDFSLYGDNKILKSCYDSDFNNFTTETISAGREMEGTVAFYANPYELNIIELEFAGVSITLKNSNMSVFAEQAS